MDWLSSGARKFSYCNLVCSHQIKARASVVISIVEECGGGGDAAQRTINIISFCFGKNHVRVQCSSRLLRIIIIYLRFVQSSRVYDDNNNMSMKLEKKSK